MTDILERLHIVLDPNSAKLDDPASLVEASHGLLHDVLDEIEQLRKHLNWSANEIKRLRKALKKIAAIEYGPDEKEDIARAALDMEP